MSEIDAAPKIYESIEGLPDPSSNVHLFGHGEVEQQMAAAFAGGRMHHAWLICGAKGVGKATLAYRFANHIFHHSTTNKPPATMYEAPADDRDRRQLAAASHPNLIHLSRTFDSKSKGFGSNISVDEIRRTRGFFGLTAADGGWRIAIIDPAEDMQAGAANALLKILEEPPAKSLFLLVCNAPGKLLPTIRSRCRQIYLRPLSTEALQNALSELYPGDQPFTRQMPQIAALAEGSVRKAIQLVDGDGLKNYTTFLALCDPHKPPDWLAIHTLAEKLALKSNQSAYQLFLDLVMGFLGRRVRQIAEPEIGQTSANNYQSVPLVRWADVWDKVENSARLAAIYNLDRKQVILSLFKSILGATGGPAKYAPSTT